MNVHVAYATRHGATQGIAERIAVRLSTAGLQADVKPIKGVGDLSGYGAFVVGSAAYIGHWLREANEFVWANRAVLTDRPTWLFSSGPLGTAPTNQLAQDKRVAAEPKEMPGLREAIQPRDHRVFSGALTPGQARAPRPGHPDPARRSRAAAGGRLPRLARHRCLGGGHRERAGASVGRPLPL
jgi:menaquinone-dependent protoporphyrinogen oxidase